ncbi:MAG: ABC transporter permease subunit [Phyllobacterium sp.]|uniref:amino acid ABC transporter permease n=1 Tax=Phyllobacterium sp. TaxID=1871046 RepID=UPI0030F33C79
MRVAQTPFGLNFRDNRTRGILYQWLCVAGVAAAGLYLFGNVSQNLARQNIATGFSYLWREAGFVISQSPINYQPSDTYAKALLVGILNTIRVSILASIVATIIGTLVGIGRLSSNPLFARLMLLYVEALRNVPLLLLLFLSYAVIVTILPPVREALQLLPFVFLSNSGLAVPAVAWNIDHTIIAATLVAGCALAFGYARHLTHRRIESGADQARWPLIGVLVFGPGVLAWLILRPDLTFSLPEPGRFRLAGGTRLTPEFVALLVGLALSASANVAEIVRSGILSIRKGQREAAAALGLRPARIMRLVILPQALRVIIPPMTSAYLNVFKNSSLAIAIGYPDVVMVSNTTMNQTGQAIEPVALFMLVYLGLSITISLFMNWYNTRVALRQR